MKAIQLRNGFYWTGIMDTELRVFDIIMYTESGTTYNSSGSSGICHMIPICSRADTGPAVPEKIIAAESSPAKSLETVLFICLFSLSLHSQTAPSAVPPVQSFCSPRFREDCNKRDVLLQSCLHRCSW